MSPSQAKTLLAARGIDCASFNDNVIAILARRVLGVAIDANRTDAIPTAHELFAARMARESEASGIHVPGGAVGHVTAPGTVMGLSPVVPPAPAEWHGAPTFVPPAVESGVFGPGGVPLSSIRPGSLV